MKTINTLGEDFVKRHQWVLDLAKLCGVALCGGCAAAISKNNTEYEPADLDLVATQESALQFVSILNRFLIERNNHFRVYVNSKNDFVPNPALAHFRITSSFWVPICLFVLPTDKFRTYKISGGYLLQFTSDVKQAADEHTAKDGKPRIASELTVEESEEIDESNDSFSIPLCNLVSFEKVSQSPSEPIGSSKSSKIDVDTY